jgi:hypothetical protein
MPSAAPWILVLALQPAGQECANPPSRASDAFWTYVEACGCARIEPLSQASPDHDRLLAACARWSARNPQVIVASPTPSPTALGQGCGAPPSRASDAYWAYVDRCGCGQLVAPSAASSDYERFMKACGGWRERNPSPIVVSPSPRTSPSPRRASPRP